MKKQYRLGVAPRMRSAKGSRVVGAAPEQHLAKIWWPESSTAADAGYLVGWSSNGFSCLVAGVVSGQSLSAIEFGLDEVAQDSRLDDVRQHCNGTLMVLGEWSNSHSKGRGNQFDEESAQRRMRRRGADLWLRMSRSRTEQNRPVLREVYCCGVSYRPSFHVVLFKFQNSGHLLTTKFSFPCILPRLVSMKKSFKAHKVSNKTIETETEIKVRQINSCERMSCCLHAALEMRAARTNASQVGNEASATASASAATEDATGLSIACEGYHLVLLGIRYLCEIILPLLECPLPLRSAERLAKQWRTDGGDCLRLIDISVLANQLHVKMRQFCLLQFGSAVRHAARCPNPYPSGPSTVRLADIRDASTRHSYTICVRNASYVAMIDTVLGLCFILLLAAQEPHVMAALEGAHRSIRLYYVDVLREYVDWLIDEPAGFKLNKDLNRFIGAFFVDCIDVWNQLHVYVPNMDRLLLQILALAGAGGLSCLLALAADIFFFTTLHIYLFYTAMGGAYKTTLRVLQSLALLFQGQKYNTLRSRADTCEFELDQLLLGVLLFALHFFLFPCVYCAPWLYALPCCFACLFS